MKVGEHDAHATRQQRSEKRVMQRTADGAGAAAQREREAPSSSSAARATGGRTPLVQRRRPEGGDAASSSSRRAVAPPRSAAAVHRASGSAARASSSRAPSGSCSWLEAFLHRRRVGARRCRRRGSAPEIVGDRAQLELDAAHVGVAAASRRRSGAEAARRGRGEPAMSASAATLVLRRHVPRAPSGTPRARAHLHARTAAVRDGGAHVRRRASAGGVRRRRRRRGRRRGRPET